MFYLFYIPIFLFVYFVAISSKVNSGIGDIIEQVQGSNSSMLSTTIHFDTFVPPEANNHGENLQKNRKNLINTISHHNVNMNLKELNKLQKKELAKRRHTEKERERKRQLNIMFSELECLLPDEIKNEYPKISPSTKKLLTSKTDISKESILKGAIKYITLLKSILKEQKQT